MDAQHLAAANGQSRPAEAPKAGGTLAAGGVGVATGTVVMFLLSQVFGVSSSIGELRAGLHAEHEARSAIIRRLDRLENHVSDQLGEIKELLAGKRE